MEKFTKNEFYTKIKKEISSIFYLKGFSSIVNTTDVDNKNSGSFFSSPDKIKNNERKEKNILSSKSKMACNGNENDKPNNKTEENYLDIKKVNGIRRKTSKKKDKNAKNLNNIDVSNVNKENNKTDDIIGTENCIYNYNSKNSPKKKNSACLVCCKCSFFINDNGNKRTFCNLLHSDKENVADFVDRKGKDNVEEKKNKMSNNNNNKKFVKNNSCKDKINKSNKKKIVAEINRENDEKNTNKGININGNKSNEFEKATDNKEDKANPVAAATAMVKNVIEEYVQKGNLPLFSFDEIPEWLRHNRYIKEGYRAHYSVKMCLRSLFKIHNETANVWTHLLGFLFFISFSTFALIYVINKTHLANVLIFLALSVSSCICMLFSATYHLFAAHRCSSVFSRMMMLDYFGITSLIICSSLPICYYAFGCDIFWRWVYISVTIGLGSIGLIGPFFEFFHLDKFYWCRLGIFMFLGLTGTVPVLHINFILPKTSVNPMFKGIATVLSLYAVGVIIYVTKVPEVLFPGRFDILFHSHQMWHLFVLAASMVHLFTSIGVYNTFEKMEQQC